MRVTGLGHAALFIETQGGSVLCDPWTGPSYFASWFPFPDNSDLDWSRYGRADYLYVSHLHRDHFHAETLRRHVRKDITVLLPQYPTDDLHDALHDLGFHSFLYTSAGAVHDLDGLQVMIDPAVAPSDGPIGDSALWLDDGTARLFNQNDAHPRDLSRAAALGPVDAHLLQFSGAIWYPMVYDLPEQAKRELGTRKRARSLERALRYADDLQATWVFPIAGPPCFLDDDLWQFNDIFDDPGNIFPDQRVFLDTMAAQGRDNGRLLLPGSVAEIAAPACPVTHAIEPDSVLGPAKEQHLRTYQARMRPRIEAERASWGVDNLDLLAALRLQLEPLLAKADRIAEGVGGPVRLTAQDPGRGDIDLVIDFPGRQVRPYKGEKVRYAFRVDRRLLETLVMSGTIDWTDLFLSCRFSASRIGPFNEYVYVFFKCLSPERLAYAEEFYGQDAGTDEPDVELNGWVMQRRCPHLRADLSRFGEVDDGVLTCHMHGWRWRLADGHCLTSVGHPLRARPAEREPDPAHDGS
jgi:UDP-MurNAc hydroxylase